MKAILEFQLPDDREGLSYALHGLDWALVTWDVDQKLRGWLKYGHDFKTADAALESCRDFIRETLREKNLTLENG